MNENPAGRAPSTDLACLPEQAATAFEEFLRYEAPMQLTRRVALDGAAYLINDFVRLAR